MKSIVFLTTASFLVLVACSSEESTMGTLGSRCYPNGTCNTGLMCEADVCVRGSEAGAPDSSQDLARADSAPDQKVDAPRTCEQVIGTKCTTSGGECGAGNTCLMISATAGFCTCKCTPDNPGTFMINEDTCPAQTKNRCAGFSGPGGTTEHYCFHYLANKLTNCTSVYFHNWNSSRSSASPGILAVALGTQFSSFTVANIQYRLWNQTSKEPCDNTLPHRVDIWVDNVVLPIPNPNVAFTINVPAATTTISLRVVDHTLATTMQVMKGESLLVAVEMRPDVAKTKTMCLAVCDGTGESSFATLGSSPPYNWGAFKAGGYAKEIAIFAHGFGR